MQLLLHVAARSGVRAVYAPQVRCETAGAVLSTAEAVQLAHFNGASHTKFHLNFLLFSHVPARIELKVAIHQLARNWGCLGRATPSFSRMSPTRIRGR